MKRGHMAAAGRISVFAAASIFLGGYAVTPATAADLGGDCCADLEERVAELEATTVRKRRRQLSMTISGRVHSAIMHWDDGGSSDDRFVSSDTEVGPPLGSSRVLIDGRAKLREGWEAGYRFSFEFVEKGRGINIGHGGYRSTSSSIEAHEAYWFVRSSRMGAISVGTRGQTYNGAAKVDISGKVGLVANADPRLYGGRVRLVNSATGQVLGGRTVRRNYFQVDDGDDGATEESGVRYDSPSMGGFILSADWTNDSSCRLRRDFGPGDSDFNNGCGPIDAGMAYDTYGIRLSFARQMDRFKVAAAVAAYTDDYVGADSFARFSQERSGVLGSFGVMHVPSGVFMNFGAGQIDFDQNAGDDDPYFWYITAGLQRKWSDRGPTTIYGQYYSSENNSLCGGGIVQSDNTGDPDANNACAFTNGTVDEHDAAYFGFGISQNFSAASLDVYAGYRRYLNDVNGTLGISVEDADVFLVGGIINF